MLDLDFKGVLQTLENVLTALTKRELISNKTNTIDENSTSEQYASAQAVYEYVEARLSEINNNRNS